MNFDDAPGASPALPEAGWYITNGATAVGPLDLALILRGVEAGKVPLDSFIRHDTWKVWRPLAELVPGAATTEPSPDSLAGEGGGPGFDARRSPKEALAEAYDLPGALLLLLGTAVQSTASEVGIVHEVRDEHAVVAWAHGPRPGAVADERAGLLDPVVLAAAAGAMVIAEPTPGPAGQRMLARLSKLGVAPTAAFMIPIRPRGRLYGMLEIGRQAAYRAQEIAGVEGLVEALVHKIELSGWS